MLIERFSASPPDGGWLTPEVAAGQRQTVESELRLGSALVPPYAAFDRALAELGPLPGWRLLDIGCGVGHYGTLIRLELSGYHLRYKGLDASPAMIAQAREREPDLEFAVMDMAEVNYAAERAEIVLMSLVAEMTPYPLALIAAALARQAGYIIWNRIRLAERSGFISESTYAGHSGPIWLWARQDVIRLIDLSRRRFQLIEWPGRGDQITVVLWPARP